MTASAYTEDQIQEGVVSWLLGLEAVSRAFTFAADMNAAKRTVQGAVWAKKQGRRPGEADLRIYLKAGRLLLVELKAKKTPVTDAQEDRHAKLADLGHPVTIVRAETPNHAINQIEALLIEAGAITGRRAA